MNKIEQAIQRLELIKKQADKLAMDIIESNPNQLSQLNRDQLKEGINAMGSDMPSYKPNSKAPRAPGAIKLFDKGDYTRGIKPIFDTSQIDMASTNQKVKFLDPKYPLALGLNSSSISVLQEKVKEELPRKLLAL